jgi:hypothetical protein
VKAEPPKDRWEDPLATNKQGPLDKFSDLSFGNELGLGSWLSENAHPLVLSRLEKLDKEPLTKVQLNQLLVVSQMGSISDGFFRYYWREIPKRHPFEVSALGNFNKHWLEGHEHVIHSTDHLHWGLYRLYVDALLYYGNVKAGFLSLRSLTHEQIASFFGEKRFDTEAISARGPALDLNVIGRDDRYLISEMACKTFGEIPETRDAALKVLEGAWDKHASAGGGEIDFRDLLKRYVVTPTTEEQLLLSYDDISAERIGSRIQVRKQFETVADKFLAARSRAIQNTEFYLSMVNDLDVYVATSMRSRQNFRDMADATEHIFNNPLLKPLHLRYFDPTLSAAKGHEDKGLIECLMVKCAKLLVYCEGEKESYGKDAEAAMALSLGKPVIFFCDHGKKTSFYRDVHPLSRLIDFRSGVAVGAIVSDDVDQVSQLIHRVFTNCMKYRIEHHSTRPGFLKLVEELTGSVIRLQTDDDLITKTFWNNYHNRAPHTFTSLAAGKEAERLQE